MTFGKAEGGGLCDLMLLRISSALDEALSGTEEAGLASHLASCPSCRLQVAELGAANRLFKASQNRRTVNTAPMEDFVEQLLQRIAVGKASSGGMAEFTRLVAQDNVLQSEFRVADSMELFVNIFMRAGWQRGYCFSRDEVVNLLDSRRAANDDLSDEQLDAVVGGFGFFDSSIGDLINEMSQRWSKQTI